MPHWKTHIQISKELNKKLNYNDEDFELFVVGSILPDINNGHVVKDVSKMLDHDITHFVYEDNKKSHENFSNKYPLFRENPLMFGYYTHIYTDYFWNSTFRKMVEERPIIEEKWPRIFKKQSDFMLYNNNFMDNTITLNNIDKILENISLVKEISINKDDLEKAKEFLDNQSKHEAILNYFTLDELDNMKEETIKFLENI